jgi:hypothetical protein
MNDTVITGADAIAAETETIPAANFCGDAVTEAVEQKIVDEFGEGDDVDDVCE